MQIVSAKISSFRSISADGINIDLGRITTIVGPNDSGKTSILLSLRGALLLLTEKTIAANHLTFFSSTFNDINLNKTNENTTNTVARSITVEVIINESKIGELVSEMYSYEDQSNAEFFYNKLLQNINAGVIKNFNEWPLVFNIDLINRTANLDISKTMDNIFQNTDSETLKSGINTLLGELYKEYLSDYIKKYEIIFIDANRKANFDNHSIDQSPPVDLYIKQEPGELANFINALSHADRREEFNKFLSYIQMVIPDIKNVRLSPDSSGVNGNRNIYIQYDGREQPLYRSGDGITNVIYLCARILQAARSTSGFSGALVIIDEPEIGMHADFLRNFIKLCQAINKDYGVQFVISTHSPYILLDSLSYGNEDKLIHTQLENNLTKIKPVDSYEDIEYLFETLGFYLPSILNSKGVIFVEGPSELNFLSVILPKIREDINNLRLAIVPLAGDQIKHIEPENLKKIHPNIFVWLDSELGSANGKLDDNREKFYNSNCNEMTVFIDLSCRLLENTYPVRALKKVFNCDKEPNIGSYADIETIINELINCQNGINKIKLSKHKPRTAERVAEELTIDEIENLNIVKEIKKWIENKLSVN